MIVVDCEQGTPAWEQARAGIPTASEFKKIYTSTGKDSTQAGTYMNALLAEWLIGGSTEAYTNKWMERGTELEAEARAAYSFENDAEVVQVGFCYRDERHYLGCSPDGLIGSAGMVEFKCPKASTHVEYLRKWRLPADYVTQVQGQLFVTDRDWCDFVSYYPGLDSFVLRVSRDEKFIVGLRTALDRFLEKLFEARRLLEQDGHFPPASAGTSAE